MVQLGLGLISWATPGGLVAFAWRKWSKARRNGNAVGDLIDNPAFLSGQILATVSCRAFIPVNIFAAARIDQPRQVLNLKAWRLTVDPLRTTDYLMVTSASRGKCSEESPT